MEKQTDFDFNLRLALRLAIRHFGIVFFSVTGIPCLIIFLGSTIAPIDLKNKIIMFAVYGIANYILYFGILPKMIKDTTRAYHQMRLALQSNDTERAQRLINLAKAKDHLCDNVGHKLAQKDYARK